jgi:predicted nucleotidyltransferase
MNLEETLRVLRDAGVEFVLIGGAAMALQGSAHLTKDMDFCYDRSRANLERLAIALEPYHPVLRGAPPGLPFQFDAETISRGLNFTLTTDLGDIDLLGEVSGLGAFASVKASSDVMKIGEIDVHVLSLAGLIRSKTAAGRPRDLYVLPELKALEELKKKTHSE